MTSHILVRPPSPSSPPPPGVPAPAWDIPTLANGDPGREAYMLLGPAWRSSTARLVRTGHRFDAVRVSQPYAAPALDFLRSRGERSGAVTAEGDRWTFFVPIGSGSLLWPSWVTYINGPAVRVPPRGARGGGFSLRWITRGEPTGRLLTSPDVLSPVLTALAPGSAPL